MRVASHAVRACSTGRVDERDVSTRPPDVTPVKAKVKYLTIGNANGVVYTVFIIFIHHKILFQILE